MKNWAFTILATAILTVPPAPAAPHARAATVDPVCMAGVRKGIANQASQFTIIVPAGQVSAMTTRGFVVQPCSGKENRVDIYRKQICRLAEVAPASVQTRFEAVHGASPAELCVMADEILGH